MNIFIIKCLHICLLQLKIYILDWPQILIMKIINHDLLLDGNDKQILNHLIENARKPILEITRKIDASGASVHQ